MAATIIRELIPYPNRWFRYPEPFPFFVSRVAEELRHHWERTSRDAACNGKLAELHAARDDYHALLKGHLRLLEEHQLLTNLHNQVFGTDTPWGEELDRAVSELRKLYDELFPRWQTKDDLAEILVEKFTLNSEQLKAYADRHPPPQSWYDETDDPFTAD